MGAEADPRAARVEARRKAYKGISSGTTLICLGVVLLLNTLGRVGWGVWFDLLRLWPLILISIGIRSIFVPTRLHPLALIGPLLVVAGTALMVQGYRGIPGEGAWDTAERRTLPLSCAGPLRGAPARLHVHFVMGNLGLLSGPAAGEGPESGLRGELRYVGSEPPWACSNEGDLWLGEEGSGGGVHVVFPFVTRRDRWEARLSSPAPVALRGEVLAANAVLDLRSFDLDHVDLDMAATNVQMLLGAPSRRVGVRLDGAATQVKLLVPSGVCFTIARERLFSVLRGEAIPRRSRGRRIVSGSCPADLTGDPPRYDFRIEMPFSTVSVETDDGA